jgi:hypothetical protein
MMFTTQDLPAFTASEIDALNLKIAELVDLGFEERKARQIVHAFLTR